jgi:hypothetical protein
VCLRWTDDRSGGGTERLGLIVFGLGLALTSGSLGLLGAAAPGAGHLVEVGVLVLANLAATVLRFLLLRGWVFRHQARGRLAEPAVPEPEEA